MPVRYWVHYACALYHRTHRPIDEFIALLQRHATEDIRAIPKKRRNPRFGRDQLGLSLRAAGIDHVYLKAPGGCCSKAEESVNDACAVVDGTTITYPKSAWPDNQAGEA